MTYNTHAETQTTVVLDSLGIVRITPPDGMEETLRDDQIHVRQAGQLRKNKRVPILVDIRRAKSQTQEARDYYTGAEAVSVASAVALWTGSRVSTVIANCLMIVMKTSVPTRMFTAEAAAVKWLKQFIEPGR